MLCMSAMGSLILSRGVPSDSPPSVLAPIHLVDYIDRLLQLLQCFLGVGDLWRSLELLSFRSLLTFIVCWRFSLLTEKVTPTTQDAVMLEYETCDYEFWYQSDCVEHMNSYNHWPECETCDRQFQTQRACNQYMHAKDHCAYDFPCETCDKKDRSQAAVDKHMASRGHWKNGM